MTQFSIIIGDRGFLRQGVGIAGVDGGQGDGGWGHRVFVRTPRAAGCDAWKTTSLWGWPCVEDDFVAGVAMYGRRLRCGTRRRPVCDCCSTLTEALLPTTCVVVNKPSALKHFPTTGLRPTVRKSFTRTAKSQQSHPAPRRLSQIRRRTIPGQPRCHSRCSSGAIPCTPEVPPGSGTLDSQVVIPFRPFRYLQSKP